MSKDARKEPVVKDMCDEIIAAAVAIAERYGFDISDDKGVTYLTCIVDRHAANIRRQGEFFDSMRSDEGRC